MKKTKKKSDLAVLLEYAGSHKWLTFLGLALSAVSMLMSMVPYICIWLVVRDLIEAAPDWTQAETIVRYGWLAFGAAVSGIVIYFIGLLCTHLAAFRTAANIRKRGRRAHDGNAAGLFRCQRLWADPGTAGCRGRGHRNAAGTQPGRHRGHDHFVSCHAGADVRPLTGAWAVPACWPR